MRKRMHGYTPPVFTFLFDKKRKEMNAIYEYDNLGGEVSFTP